MFCFFVFMFFWVEFRLKNSLNLPLCMHVWVYPSFHLRFFHKINSIQISSWKDEKKMNFSVGAVFMTFSIEVWYLWCVRSLTRLFKKCEIHVLYCEALQTLLSAAFHRFITSSQWHRASNALLCLVHFTRSANNYPENMDQLAWLIVTSNG